MLTVAFGILTFYPSPEAPGYPSQLIPKVAVATAPGATPAPVPQEERERFEAALQDYEQRYDEYEDDRAAHRRNVLLIATVIAALVIAVGVAASAALDVFRVGLMLGGLFTVLWALIYGAEDADPSVLFVATLLVLVLLGALSQSKVRDWLGRTLRLGEGDDLLGR